MGSDPLGHYDKSFGQQNTIIWDDRKYNSHADEVVSHTKGSNSPQAKKNTEQDKCTMDAE